jgi:hypothetical protein
MRLHSLLIASTFTLASAVAAAACLPEDEPASDGSTSEKVVNAEAGATDCGKEGQTCCTPTETQRACEGALGCAAGTCQSIVSNMVAYAEYCKVELGFTNPQAKLPYMSCFDSAGPDGKRRPGGHQALISLTMTNEEIPTTTYHLETNGPAVRDGKDVWDLIYGANGSDAQGCDDPNYLQGRCDPYYRLNVWEPDPANQDIVAALHCRSSGEKPSPSSAILAEDRLKAFTDAPEEVAPQERARLFDQWNASSEIVLIMTNHKTGATCFFHAAEPYYGSHIPAPDDETDLTTKGADQKVWNELPVQPPYGIAERRNEWLRNGASAWARPDKMQCTNCHDSGPWMHDPFIDSAGVLPDDKAARPYKPLGYNARFPIRNVKTDPVKGPDGELTPQRCQQCHNIGNSNTCSTWIDRAVGLSYPAAASFESKIDPQLGKYMPQDHVAKSNAEYWEEWGAHIDAIKCCCAHPTWLGCRTTNAFDSSEPPQRGTGPQACIGGECGGWRQACCGGTTCNHNGLSCASNGLCLFAGELPDPTVAPPPRRIDAGAPAPEPMPDPVFTPLPDPVLGGLQDPAGPTLDAGTDIFIR